MIKTLEFLLVGNRGEKSLSDYRRAVLTAYSILVSVGTSVFYLVLNLITRNNPSTYFYYMVIAVATLSFLLNRAGHHWWAKNILLLIINLVVFAFSSRKPGIPSAFLFFIIASLMALVLFDGKEKFSSMFFISLSFSLYLVARFTDFSLVPTTPIDPDYLVRAYNNNFLIVYIFSIIAVYFMVKINHSVEASLEHRERQIMEKNIILMKTNEELDHFIYSTSHDLRAPLNSIEGLINLSEISEDISELRLYQTMMRDRVEKLQTVLKDISLYSKNAKLEVENRRIYLTDFIRKAVYDAQFLEPARNVRIAVDIPEDTVLETDPMRLNIILNNLIVNAIRYSDPGKNDPHVIVKSGLEGNRQTITVEDNGEGIEAEHLPKIFTMFYRASIRSQGSGLGLFLVKETVEKLGATISVESRKNIGTTFTVAF